MSRRVGPAGAVLAPLAAVVALLGLLTGPIDPVTPVGAQAQNRAAVIVNTGGATAAVCVRFPEPAISGLDALQRSGLGPVIRGFAGQGGAVCGINGVGCPADDSCLTCQAPSYWAYHRASPGAGGFTYSSAGAGSTQVTDGSVEGWQWGTGGAPPFQSVDQVCGPAAAPPPPPPPAADDPSFGGGGRGRSGSGSGGTGGGGGRGGPAASPAAPPTTGSVATTTTVAETTSTTTEDRAADRGGEAGTDADADLVAATSPLDAGGDDAGGGTSGWALGLFLVLVIGIGGAAVVVRRRRAT